VTAREAQLFAQGPATRDRFLVAIAERVSPDRMQAVYLFPPIRSGHVETGVAVLAVDPLPPVTVRDLEPADVGLFEHPPEEAADVPAAEPYAEPATEPVAPPAPATAMEHTDPLDAAVDDALAPVEGADARSPRPLVLTARYRHTLKGPDRGAWFVEVHEQADAPLATVEMVVAGVARRHDDSAEPERLDAEAVRLAVTAGTWATPTR
jgi:hypothetical protein